MRLMTILIIKCIFDIIYTQTITEDHRIDKYIKCSRCKCKYINDNEHIKHGFGYNRLEERYTTCVKCRENTLRETTHNTTEKQHTSLS